MLLQIQHLGIKDTHRFYHVQTPRGLQGIVDMCGEDAQITLLLVGTSYRRDYPAAGKLDSNDPPRIRDLEGGYQTIQTFLSTWEQATPEQREDLWLYDKPLALGRYDWSRRRLVDRPIRSRDKWPTQRTEDRPRVIAYRGTSDDWFRVYTKDLRAALKGITLTVRIGGITCKASLLRQAIDAKSALAGAVVELRNVDGQLALRSADHKATIKVKHGAGDPCAGRNGFQAKIVLERAEDRIMDCASSSPRRTSRRPRKARLTAPARPVLKEQRVTVVWRGEDGRARLRHRQATVKEMPFELYREQANHNFTHLVKVGQEQIPAAWAKGHWRAVAPA